MTESDTTRIALIEAENRHLKTEISELKEEVRDRLSKIEGLLDKLNTSFTKVAGAYSGLFALLALAGGIGAIITRFWFK